MSYELVVYQFGRSKVESGDFSHFLEIYGPDNLPSGRRLRDMMNTLVFQIDGYNDDPRELHSIPEIRRFYEAFHKAWPYRFYFCNLDSEELQMMVLCCLPSIAALKIDEAPKVSVEYDRSELLNFINSGFGPMNLLCERGGMFESAVFDRTKAVFEYFALPFNAPSPS